MTDYDWTHTMTHTNGDQRVRVRVDEDGVWFDGELLWLREIREEQGWTFEPRPKPTLQERFESLPVGTRVEVEFTSGNRTVRYRSSRGTSKDTGDREGWSPDYSVWVSFVVLEPVGEVQS